MMFLSSRWALWLVFVVLLLKPVLPTVGQQDMASLAEEGPYQVGVRVLDFVDERRNDRFLQTDLWYPATVEGEGRINAPDSRGAPYPLIIWSHGYGDQATSGLSLVIELLVSQGYVVAGINHQDSEEDWWSPLVERPLDILFVLNQLADLQDEAFANVIATDKVGVIGYSFGGYGAIAAAGARIDQEAFFDWCLTAPYEVHQGYCDLVDLWDQFPPYQEDLMPLAEDGLWLPTTDARIRAVLPIAPCNGPLINERGLAGISIPVLIIAGTEDVTCPYGIDARYMYDHLVLPDRYLVTLKGRDHVTLLQYDLVQEYAAAFFGKYLQGKDYMPYLAPKSAAAFDSVTLEVQLEDP